MSKLTDEEKKIADDMERLMRERKPKAGFKIHAPDKFSMDITKPLPKKKSDQKKK